MPRVIKGTGLVDGVINAYERGALEAIDPDMLGEDGRADPAAVLAQAREQAEQLVREAYAEGMRRGAEAGKQQFDTAIREAADVLHAAAEELKLARAEFLFQTQREIVRLAGAMAQQVLRREVQLDEKLATETARAALLKLCDQERVTLRVHPQDLAALKEQRIALLEEFDGIEQLDVRPSEDVARGGCIAESATLYIDAQLDAQLRQILERLES